MVKFCENVSPLNSKEVGRKDSVKREVSLLLREYDGEKTIIKKKMWTLKEGTFVSVYCGRICVGVIMMNTLKFKRKNCYHISNAVVDKRARSRGLGRQMAQICMRAAFTTDCHAMYLGAELTESDCPETGETIIQKPSESGAVRFWKKLKFRRISMREYEKFLKDKDLYGMVPMKMTHRSKAVKALPHLEEVMEELFPKLREISREFDGKEREPMLRICTSEIGDVKIRETDEEKPLEFIFHSHH
jgi:GNAT superfamily N-acetyltransferase